MSHTGTVGPQEAHLPYRRDIDSLRAIAVLAVLFFHAFPQWVHGGFVGIEIFFAVISGNIVQPWPGNTRSWMPVGSVTLNPERHSIVNAQMI